MNFDLVTLYCNERKLSIHEFEKLCNLGNGTVGKWKQGKAEPSIKTLSKISKHTGIPMNRWIGGES